MNPNGRPEWLSRAKPVEGVRVEVGFMVAKSFYYGPENRYSKEQWEQLREPLYQPAGERYGDFLLSAELKESAAGLIRYYQDVLRLVARHRKDIAQHSHYFWMPPLLFARGNFAITFPWYDTWDETVRLFDALANPADGELFHDMDQGWEFQAIAEGDRLFLRQGNFDSGEDRFVIATDRAQVVRQIPEVRERVARLLKELAEALGRDYWSRRGWG